MKNSSGVQALVFDAYGTLFDVHSVIALCDQLFPGKGTILSQLWRAKQLEYTWLRSLMDRYEDFWEVTESALVFACQSLGLDCEGETRARLMDAYLHLEPFPDARVALSALSQYPLAILSNGSPRMLHAAVSSAEFQGIFAKIISVDEAGIYKPSPLVYQLAPEKLGVERASVGFVSSNSWDVIGAKTFGFWTCWVNRSNSQADVLGATPNITVNRLTDLVSALER